MFTVADVKRRIKSLEQHECFIEGSPRSWHNASATQYIRDTHTLHRDLPAVSLVVGLRKLLRAIAPQMVISKVSMMDCHREQLNR